MLAYLRNKGRKASDTGATAVEYGLMVAAIAAVIVGLVFGIGSLVQTAFQTTNDCLKDGQAASTAAGTKCNP